MAFSFRGNAAAAEETAAAVQRARPSAPSPVQGDVSDPAAADGLIKAALEAFGKVDILVNNAGITRDDLIMRMSIEAWQDVINTNLSGAFYAIKAVTRPMLKAKGGRIINITSVSGQAGQTGPGELLVGEGRADRPDEGDRPRARLARDHLQRRRAGLRADGADEGPGPAAPGPDHGRDAARALRHARGDRQRGRVPRQRRGRLHHRVRSSPSTAAW